MRGMYVCTIHTWIQYSPVPSIRGAAKWLSIAARAGSGVKSHKKHTQVTKSPPR